MSWADEQIKKDRDAQESQRLSDELRLREQRLKDEVGKGEAGGMESSSPTSSPRISLIGAHFGGWEEWEEYFEASA